MFRCQMLSPGRPFKELKGSSVAIVSPLFSIPPALLNPSLQQVKVPIPLSNSISFKYTFVCVWMFSTLNGGKIINVCKCKLYKYYLRSPTVAPGVRGATVNRDQEAQARATWATWV